MVLVDSVNTSTASHRTTPEQRYTTFCGTVYGIGIYYTASCGMVSKYPKNRTVYTSTQDGFFCTTLCLRGGGGGGVNIYCKGLMDFWSIIHYLSSTLISAYIKVALCIVLHIEYNTQSYSAQF
jgi:hypothetical protein